MTEWNIPEIYHIPIEHKEVLVMLLDKVARALEKASIPYFIDGGTLLGAVRHKGQIPFDDDVDIGVFHTDFNDLAHILYTNIVKNDKYEISIDVISPAIIKVFVRGMWVKNTVTGATIGTPTLDIFKWEKHQDQVRLWSRFDRIDFKNCFYKKKEFYPLQDYVFENIIVKGSNNPEKYLHRYYGEDCLDVCKIDLRTGDDWTEKNREAICFYSVYKATD